MKKSLFLVIAILGFYNLSYSQITSVVAEVTRCNGNVADEALCPDETDDVAFVDVTVAFSGPIGATFGLQLTEANIISPASPIDIAPATVGLQDSTYYIFKDIEIPADGATAFNFQIDLYENTIATIVDTETEALAAEDPCSCFQYACNDDETFQSIGTTGFIADPDYTQEYLLADLAGNILDRNATGIFDITALTPGTIYAIYGFSYLTADAAVVLSVTTIDDLYNIEDIDPCVDAAVSIAPCYLEIPSDFTITNTDPCDDINQITIDDVLGGLDPDLYCNATSNSDNGSFPYTIFVDNDNDVTNGFIAEANATIMPVAFTSATYTALEVSTPTDFFVHVEDGTDCIETLTVTVYPDYTVTVITDEICLSPDETTTTIPNYELFTNLLVTPAPPSVNMPGTWSSSDVFITDPSLATANIDAALLDAQLSGSGSTTIEVNYTTAPGTACPTTFGPYVLTLTRLAIPTGMAYSFCEGDAIPVGEGLSTDCGVNTNWYDTDGTTFLTQVATGGFFDPFGGIAPTLTPGTYTYFAECVDAGACVSERIGVTLTIDPKPTASAIADQEICINGTIVDITPSGGSSSSYTLVGPAGSVGPQTTAFTQADLQTAGFDETTAATYTFNMTEISANECASNPVNFNIIVNAEPLVSASADVTICDGESTTLTASSIPVDASMVFTWFDDAGLTSVVGTGSTVSVTPATTTSYFVTADLAGCVSAIAAEVVVTVSPIASPLSVTEPTVCEGGTTLTDFELEADCGGETVDWYDSATGGSLLLSNSATFTPSGAASLAAGSYTYYVQCTNAAGCESARLSMTLTIESVPTAPTVSDETICLNGTITDITPLGGTGSSFAIIGPSGNAGPQTLFTDADLTGIGLDGTTAGTYNFHIIETNAAGCESVQSDFDITVSPEPVVSASADVTICDGSGTTITATSVPADGATIYTWYSDAGLTTSVGTGASLTVIPTATPTSYFVTASLNGCVSAMASEVEVTLSDPAAPTVVTEPTVCEGSTPPSGFTNWKRIALRTVLTGMMLPTGGTLLLANSGDLHSSRSYDSGSWYLCILCGMRGCYGLCGVLERH